MLRVFHGSDEKRSETVRLPQTLLSFLIWHPFPLAFVVVFIPSLSSWMGHRGAKGASSVYVPQGSLNIVNVSNFITRPPSPAPKENPGFIMNMSPASSHKRPWQEQRKATGLTVLDQHHSEKSMFAQRCPWVLKIQ